RTLACPPRHDPAATALLVAARDLEHRGRACRQAHWQEEATGVARERRPVWHESPGVKVLTETVECRVVHAVERMVTDAGAADLNGRRRPRRAFRVA